MEKKTKKEWKKPELVILVRSRPEEAILTPCKNTSDKGTKSCSLHGGCPNSTTIGS
jgi:hypothetical protein